MNADGTVTNIHMDGQLDVLASEWGLQSLKN